MDQPYLTMGSPALPTVDEGHWRIVPDLIGIVRMYPPRDNYAKDALHGLWSSPTGIAYLLLQVSVHQPELSIQATRRSTGRVSTSPGARAGPTSALARMAAASPTRS